MTTTDLQDVAATSSSAPGRLLTWLQLMRLPTVFTALSNILCGFLITHRTPRLRIADLPGQSDLWLLLASTAGLYLGGMVLNDVFDARLDAVERPERPIPSGRISRTAAGVFGAVLMMLGLSAAAMAGTASLLIAGLIVPCVLCYNGYLKSTIAAPLGMGACRFFNLMLGASAVPSLAALWHPTSLTVAAALAIYVIGVTVFARNEAGRSSTAGLICGVTLLVSGIGLDAWFIGTAGATPNAVSGGRMALLLLSLNLLMRAAAAVSQPEPKRIQRTVGLMLLCIIFLDAIVVFSLTADAKLSALVIMLVAPASLLRRVVPMS
jgi:4-hydroxybenzoate polyprenyltransferase